MHDNIINSRDLGEIDGFDVRAELGPSFIIDGVQQPDTFANGYGTYLVAEAIADAKQATRPAAK